MRAPKSEPLPQPQPCGLRLEVRPSVLAVAAVAALMLGACSSSQDPAQPPGATGAADAGASGDELPCEDTPALDMNGVWAAFMRFSVALQSQPGGVITVCPADQTRQTSLLLLLDIHQSQQEPLALDSMKATACWLELPTVTAIAGSCTPDAANLVTTQIIAPPPMLEALPALVVPPRTGALSALEPGARWMPERFAFTLGADPNAGSLPVWQPSEAGCGMADIPVGRTETCEAGCVDRCEDLIDADADGWPGVTANVCGTTPDDVAAKVECNAQAPNAGGVTLQGRAFIDFQVDPLLAGIVRSSCEVTGSVDARVLYNIVGADIYLASTQISVASAIQSLPTFQVDPDSSRFRMIRVDGRHGAPDWKIDVSQAASACAAAIQHRNELL